MSPFTILADLLLREERRPPARPVGPLADAAAALGAGEAKRATSVLAAATHTGDGAAVAAAFAHAAAALDANWFPGGGGAVLAHLPQPVTLPARPPADPGAALVAALAVRLVAAAPQWRSIADGARRTGGLSAGIVLDEAMTLLNEAVTGWSRAVGPVALVIADLHVRFGTGGETLLWGLARSAYGNDAIGLADCALAELDAAVPGGRPELLGEDLEGLPAELRTAPAEMAARYAAVGEAFEAAGSDRGVAAVALRQSRLAADAGDADGATAHLARAGAHAAAGGDSALVVLAATHAALLDVELGRPVDPDAAAGPVITWATTVGSTSWARGLARLCWRRAERLRAATDPVRGERALRLADAVAAGVGADLESALVRREQAAAYGAVNYRRAAARLLIGELTDALDGSGPGPTGTAWAVLVEQAVAAHGDAVATRDPDLLLEARVPLDRLAAIGAAIPPELAVVESVLADTRAESAVLEPLYRATAARDAGDPDGAETAFAAAYGAAGAPGLRRSFVLATQRRFDEAAAIVEPAWRSGALPPYPAAALLARIGRFTLAAEALAAAPPGEGGPWRRPALEAEVLLGTGRLADADVAADIALRRFEDDLARLPRDVLRTTALDAPDVAGLYTTAVRICADTGQVDRAFALSDRSRGMTLTDLLDADRDAATPAVAAAVRAWQRAGAELGRTVEEVGGARLAPATARTRIRGAERALDEAEAALAAGAPALYSGRRRLPAPVTVTQVQEQLAEGTLLLQCHAFDDHLVTTVLTRDSADVRSTATVTGQLAGDVRRFHRLLADPASSPAERERLGSALATTLLGPVAEEVDAHRRLVVVPYGGLAVLPFPALPWGGAELGTAGRVVSLLPAVSAVLGRSPAPSANGDALVVGDPDYGPGGPPRLPGTGVEARAVAAALGVRALLGRHADRDTVLDRLAATRQMHLATHGFLRESSPYSAYLALAGGDRLTVPDLTGAGLHIDLAVLSACDSGRGRATAAGDVVGLTRALIGSGVRGLVVSLWPVDDVLACLMMVRFHERRAAGSPPAEALAEAAAWLRALSPQAAAAHYGELAGSPRAEQPRRRTARNVAGQLAVTPGADPSHPSAWAPFVHIGVP